MKNFRIIAPEELNDRSRYEPAEEGIYRDLHDKGGYATYRLAMAMEQEEGEDSQYPLEDILDHYLVHVEVFLDAPAPGIFQAVFGGELDDLQNFKTIIGKRAFNEDFVDDDGKTRVRLRIE
jgi:hypothetical protein